MKHLCAVVSFPSHERLKQLLNEHRLRTVVKGREVTTGRVSRGTPVDSTSFQAINSTEVRIRCLQKLSHLTHKEKHLALQLREAKENKKTRTLERGALVSSGGRSVCSWPTAVTPLARGRA